MKNIFFAILLLTATSCGLLLPMTTNQSPVDILVTGDAGVTIESKSGVYQKGREEYALHGMWTGDSVRLKYTGIDTTFFVYNKNYTYVFDVKKNSVKRDSFPK